jgi:hypothetical protein
MTDDAGDRLPVVLDRDHAQRQRVELLLTVGQRVFVVHHRIDEELLEEAAAEFLEDLHVAEQRADLFRTQLHVVHEGQLVDERGGVIDAVEESHQLAEGLQALEILFLAADLVNEPSGLEQQLLERLIAVGRGFRCSPSAARDRARKLARDVPSRRKPRISRVCWMSGSRLAGYSAGPAARLLSVSKIDSGTSLRSDSVHRRINRARAEDRWSSGAGSEDALVLVDELLIVGMAIDDIDLDALALVGIDDVGLRQNLFDRGRNVVHGSRFRVGLPAKLGQALVGAMHHAHDDQRRLRLGQRFEHLVRQRQELPGADAAGALQQLARALERRFLPVADVVITLAVVAKKK